MIQKLQEKASIDWNNYLTKQEVKKFLSKDDKVESAEEIVYNTKGDFYNKYFKDFKKQGWTKRELTKDLAQFFYNGHLITESINNNFFVLRGTQDGKTFDIAYSDNKQKLQNFKDEMTKSNSNVSMWIDENDNITNNNDKLVEGIHLYGFIKDEDGNSSVKEDTDYSTKIAYEKDLKANGYKVRRINDNRDMYVMDHSDFSSVTDVKNRIKQLQKDIEYNKENNYSALVAKCEEDIKGLQELLDKANKISLTENNNKLEESSIPNKYKHLVNGDIYKGADGYWVIDLKDNYTTPYGTNYIRTKTKREAILELEDVTSEELDEDKLIESSGEEWIKVQYNNLRTLQNRFRDILKVESNLGYATTGKPKLEFIYKGTHFTILFIRNNIDKNRKGTFYLLYPDNKQFKNGDDIERYIMSYKKKTENTHKVEEASRNELLAKTKMQTKTRYNKADGYKGFGLKNVNIDKLLVDGTLPVTCKVGKYNDTVELENVPYWIQLQANRNNNNQLTNHVVRDAILQAVDAMDIKVDCDCGDFKYRMAWGATEGGYKYGEPENRPANITNPNKYGALCKHLTAMLSNKKWMQQVAAPVLDYIEEHLEELNKFLNVKQGEELTMSNQLARGMAKKAAQGRKQDREERLQDVAKEFIQQRRNFIIRNANDEDELLEGIKAYINYKYKDQASGVDYLKADTMEQEYILDIVNKWLIDHNYKKDYEEEFEQQNNETEQNNEEGEESNEEPKQ